MSAPTEKSTLAPVPAHLARYRTPVHVFHEDNLLADAAELEEGLKSSLPGAALYYSTKTNSLLPLLRALVARGWGLEVVAPKDRKQAVAAGCGGDKVLLNGAAWTREGLEEALFTDGIRNVTLDSECMAELLGSVLRSKPGVRLNVALRLHDGNSHFGFPASRESFERAWGFLPRGSVESVGFHIHVNPAGSIRSLDELSADFRARAKRVNEALIALGGSPWKPLVQFCDLGGGIDSPFVYRPHPAELGEFHNPRLVQAFREKYLRVRFSLREAGAELGRAVRAELGDFWVGKKIFFEPGRAVCTRALSTIVEVRSVKPGFYPDAEVVLTDGNTAILGPVHRGVHLISALKAGELVSTFVYGNLPHSGDWLFQSVPLPRLNVGDRLLISHTGAYYQPLEAAFGHELPKVVRADRDEMVKG